MTMLTKDEIKELKVASVISNFKKQLMRKWERKGGYENFGAKEENTIREMFKGNIGSSSERKISKMINEFHNWSNDYEGDKCEIWRGYND